MAQSRHWRQKFDEDAEFIFRRRVHLSGDTFTEIGGKVDKESLPRHRLRAWWGAGLIELAPAGSVAHRGGPWFEVSLPSGEKKTVRGKAAAEALLSGE